MRSQIGVESLAVEVVGDGGGSACCQSVEGVPSGQQEGDRADRVLALRIERLSVDRHRRDALAVGLGRIVGVCNVARKPQLEHGPGVLRVELRLPLLFERLLEVGARDGHVAQLVGEGLDGEGLAVGDVAVGERGEVGSQAAGVDGADVHGLAFLRDHGGSKGVGGEVAERGFDAPVGPWVGGLAGGGEDPAGERGRIALGHNLVAGCLGILHRLVDDPFDRLLLAARGHLGGGDELGLGADHPLRGLVVGDLQVGEVVGVGAGGYRGELVALGAVDHRKLVGDVGVAAHDAVDVCAHLRVVVLHVVVEHGDHDIGLAGNLEVLGHRIDLGYGVVEGQSLGGAGAQLVGHVAGDGPDEGDPDAGGRRPDHFVAEVAAHAVDVGPEVGETDLRVAAGSVDAVFEDVEAEVELMVADGRAERFELVERGDRRIVLQGAGRERGGSDVVAEQGEGGVSAGRARPVQVAADGRDAGFGDGPVLARLLDVSVDVGEVVQVEGHGSARFGGCAWRRTGIRSRGFGRGRPAGRNPWGRRPG